MLPRSISLIDYVGRAHMIYSSLLTQITTARSANRLLVGRSVT